MYYDFPGSERRNTVWVWWFCSIRMFAFLERLTFQISVFKPPDDLHYSSDTCSLFIELPARRIFLGWPNMYMFST